MRIKTVTVRSGTTHKHPTQEYSNLQASIEMTADLQDGEDETIAIRDLQSRADAFMAQHKQQQIDAILAAQRCLEEPKREPQKSVSDFRQGEIVRFNVDLQGWWTRGETAQVIRTEDMFGKALTVVMDGSKRSFGIAPIHLHMVDHYIPF